MVAMKSGLILLLAALALAHASPDEWYQGSNIHVVPEVEKGQATDAPWCSQDRPCSLVDGLRHAKPGDSLRLAEGRYKTNAVVEERLSYLSIRGEGTDATIIESGGELNADGTEVLLDIRAPHVLIRDIAFVINGSLAQYSPSSEGPSPAPAPGSEPADEPTSAPAPSSEAPAPESLRSKEDRNETDAPAERVAILIRSTSTGTALQDITVTLVDAAHTGETEFGAGPKGIVVHGYRNKVQKLLVKGKFQDGIHVSGSHNFIKQVEVDGARRTGILLAYPSAQNKVKGSVIRSIGCRNATIGTGIEVQGRDSKIKQVEFHNWGQFAIHICGNGGTCQEPCHYVSDVPEEERFASKIKVKNVKFPKHRDNTTICNGANDTIVKGTAQEQFHYPRMSHQDIVSGVFKMLRGVA